MNTKKKVGVCLVIIGGIGLAYVLACLGLIYVGDGVLGYAICIIAFIVGISLLIWGYRGLRAH